MYDDEDPGEAPETIENVVDMNAARERLKKGGRPKKTASQEDEEYRNLLAAASEFLDQHQFRECLRQKCYFIRKANGLWIPVSRSHFGSHFPTWGEKFGRAVTNVMHDRGWNYLDCTYTYGTCPKDTFNMLDRSRWIQPDVGEYHWLFDVLIQSLSGNKYENRDHLEHVLAYKYLHPWVYTLPCLLIHGEGGVGKNVLVDLVLYEMLDRQTYSGEAKDVIGDFNGIVKGMGVVMIDEAEADSTCSNALKHRVGRVRLTINDKNIAQYEIDNTALYIISSNKSEGGVWLDRSTADRRYSVLHVLKGQALPYWIAIHEGDLPPDCKYLDKNDPIYRKWYQWMLNEGQSILTDHKQIANWLGALLDKHGDRPHPLPLHGADFKRLMDIQKPMDEKISEAVFTDPDFKFIEKAVLHKGYVLCCQEDGQKGWLKQGKFYERVREWLERNRPDIVEAQIRVTEWQQVSHDPHDDQFAERRPRVWIGADQVQWGGNDNPNRKSTMRKYLREHGYNKFSWIGPDVG